MSNSGFIIRSIAFLIPFAIGGIYNVGLNVVSTKIDNQQNKQNTNTELPKQRAPSITSEVIPETTSVCPREMVEIDGEHCEAVLHVCKHWISQAKDRCAEYFPTSKCIGKTTKMHFCIDKYEAGNAINEYVPRDITWYKAKELCESQGKRLPTIFEWELSCEGPERTPYPYGYVRDASVCNIDKPYITPDNNLWIKDRNAEINRLDQSEVSGTRPGCCSAYGVCDMTGNLDEWTYDPTGHDDGGNGKEAHYKSALKGGWWGPIRARCRPKTATHNESHHWYQTSYRCVKDIKQ